MSWGKRVTWNGGNGTYSQFDILYNKNNYLGWNDISSCNRQGLDGGVVESCEFTPARFCSLLRM
jgi:hypothetical protein|eukprot:COSAG02_NODE_729_length_17991_cov_15.636262_5_plen_64_part_00